MKTKRKEEIQTVKDFLKKTVNLPASLISEEDVEARSLYYYLRKKSNWFGIPEEAAKRGEPFTFEDCKNLLINVIKDSGYTNDKFRSERPFMKVIDAHAKLNRPFVQWLQKLDVFDNDFYVKGWLFKGEFIYSGMRFPEISSKIFGTTDYKLFCGYKGIEFFNAAERLYDHYGYHFFSEKVEECEEAFFEAEKKLKDIEILGYDNPGTFRSLYEVMTEECEGDHKRVIDFFKEKGYLTMDGRPTPSAAQYGYLDETVSFIATKPETLISDLGYNNMFDHFEKEGGLYYDR